MASIIFECSLKTMYCVQSYQILFEVYLPTGRTNAVPLSFPGKEEVNKVECLLLLSFFHMTENKTERCGFFGSYIVAQDLFGPYLLRNLSRVQLPMQNGQTW